MKKKENYLNKPCFRILIHATDTQKRLVANFRKGYRGDSEGHRLNSLGFRRGRTPRPKSKFSMGQLLTMRQLSDAKKPRAPISNIPEAIPDIPGIPDTGGEESSMAVASLLDLSPQEDTRELSVAQPKDSAEGRGRAEKPPKPSIFVPAPSGPPTLEEVF